MKKLLNSLALLLAVVCLVWLAVLWRWQVTRHEMTVDDIALYLIVLPLVVFVLVLALRWAWRKSAVKAAAGAAAAAASLGPGGAATAAANTAPSAEAQERHIACRVLASGVNCASGNGLDAVCAAQAAGEPRPALDALLKDDDGLPLMCARVKDLDVAPVDEALEELARQALASPPAGQDDTAPAPEMDVAAELVRALALLADPLRSVLSELEAHEEQFNRLPDRVLRVQLNLPSTWSAAQEQLAKAWLNQQLLASGMSQARLLVQSQRAGLNAVWRSVDQLLLTMHREHREDLMLVLACHSDLSEQAVQELANRKMLYSPALRGTGVMPGEGAAALLLAPVAWQVAASEDQPAVLLHRAASALRNKPVDAGGRVNADTLTLVCTQALEVAHTQAAQVLAVVSDADQHTPRAAEFMGMALALNGELDAAEDLWLQGANSGHMGAVAPLVAVASAAHLAAKRKAPSLAVSVADAVHRMALVALLESPAPKESAAP